MTAPLIKNCTLVMVPALSDAEAEMGKVAGATNEALAAGLVMATMKGATGVSK